jgi:peptidoglycan/xylan/chitin deacetylase (PgdA/CDA1 family)
MIEQHPIPILLYHSIDADRPKPYGRWVVTPACFEAHLALLQKEGFSPMTVEALASAKASGKSLPAKSVVITFDDGLADFLLNAMPILAKFGFPATLYVTSGHVGSTAEWLAHLGQGDRPMLTWRQIADLANAGIEIGAHSVSHPQLDLIGIEEARRQIIGSRDAIEDMIGRPVRSFAYPHGYSTRATRQMVSDAGLRAACGVRHALSSSREDPFQLSRIIMEQSMTPSTMKRFLSGSGLPIAPGTCPPKVFGWRQVRRARQVFEKRSLSLASLGG